MKIGIDARLWGEAGVGRYLRNLVFELSKIDDKNEYYLLLLEKNFNQKLPKNFHQIKADFRWYSLKEQTRLPILLNSLKLDLVHFPHINVPIFYQGKYVVTVHDLIHQHHKMKRATTLNPLIYQIKHFAYNHVLKIALKKSQKIITVSNYVKNQLIDEMKVPDEKIIVTYEAAEEELIALAKACTLPQMNKVLEKFAINQPFIFYVGNAHPHKNVEGMIKAFLQLRKSYQYLQLVLSGHDHYFWERVKREFQKSDNNYKKDVIFTGYITDQELVALYKMAKVYVFPSFEEGFGIPILEAFACGCPVVSSKLGSLPEVGSDACLYFNPGSTDDMSKKIQEVLNDQNLRKELIGKGEKRYKQFEWKKLAVETLKAYGSV